MICEEEMSKGGKARPTGKECKDMNRMEERDNRTHAQKRRAGTQEALRERLQGMGLLTEIERDLNRTIGPDEFAQVKFKTEVRLRLLDELLPNLKAAETRSE